MELKAPTQQDLTRQAPAHQAYCLAGRESLARISALRNELCEHDQAFARTARNMMAGTLLFVIVLYGTNAAGAAGISDNDGILALLAATVLAMTGIWIIDRRLVQQIRDAKLRSQYWLSLVDTVRRGELKPALLGRNSPQEPTLEKLLRKDAATAARFIAASGSLEPCLPFYRRCIGLRKATS